ncbi:hypothetical protein [Peribacillus sp. SI8-4]|uniref:hypothetical protein n=1 Tax=Peribacillus sp. SI8-4 TaxID=3048009 RepID=UPI0025557032|nr:hypothetical protein [Peribacillus sp. SI8-4]
MIQEGENSLDRVIQINVEMKELEAQLDQLRKELSWLRENCAHEFEKKEYIQKCLKCQLIESLQW